MRDSYVKALKVFLENGHVQASLEPSYLIEDLKERDILTMEEANGILSKHSRLARQKELYLGVIPKRGNAAFRVLLEIMDQEKYGWAREMLESLCEKEVSKVKPAWFRLED